MIYDSLYEVIRASCLLVYGDDLEEVIIYGGYGRQEGHIKNNDKIILRNDVDIILVLPRPHKEKTVRVAKVDFKKDRS